MDTLCINLIIMSDVMAVVGGDDDVLIVLTRLLTVRDRSV